MNILIYQNIKIRHLNKANVINTLNVAKGFQQNNCNIFYAIKDKIIKEFISNQINCKFIFINNIINQINENKINIVYSRDLEFAKYLIENNYNGTIILESHEPNAPDNIELYRNHKNLIFTSISPIIIKKFAIEKNLLFPCSIDFNFFSNKTLFKNDLFNKTKKNITYCGHLYDYKGIPIILKVAERNPEYIFHLVGGKEEDIERHKKISGKNVIFHGHKDYKDVPNYLYSSDILLIPYSANGNKHSPSNITSPIKLFEYLATKIPVICSDIAGIKNWINEEDATFFKADNFNDFENKIRFVIDNINSDCIKNKCKTGYKKAQYYTTKNKCKKLLDLIK